MQHEKKTGRLKIPRRTERFSSFGSLVSSGRGHKGNTAINISSGYKAPKEQQNGNMMHEKRCASVLMQDYIRLEKNIHSPDDSHNMFPEICSADQTPSNVGENLSSGIDYQAFGRIEM